MTATALSLGEYLGHQRPDMALMTGIAGTFSDSLTIGEVVEIVEECLPELGAESPKGFLGLQELGFSMMQVSGKKIYNEMRNDAPCFPHLAQARGLTVNTVSGVYETIRQRREKWRGDVESMEGAAFFLAMLRQGIPFAELRGISNRVEPRNRKGWDVAGAALAAQREVWRFLQQLDSN